MSDELLPHRRLRAGDADRDAVLNVLQRAHAAGRLTVEELGERQDAALLARFTDEFPQLVADLPEGGELAVGHRRRCRRGPTPCQLLSRGRILPSPS